jgi:sterol desaturase/sphingolipid hydroxylase (fatty acid hydroxylase superfamily)
MKATAESPRMFENDFVDFFSRTHPAIVPILFVPTSLYLLYLSITRGGMSVAATAGLSIMGFVSWTLTEYWLHRTFFHWVPKGKWGERMHFLVHGVHHTWPKDKYRLVMPPAVSISLFWIFLGLFAVTLGNKYMWGFHAGFVAGYMTYDVTHYYIHHFNPKSKFGLTLKKHHMLHHFKDHDSRFGVSSRAWDHVFGTLPAGK